jgi:hypothetical protein
VNVIKKSDVWSFVSRKKTWWENRSFMYHGRELTVSVCLPCLDTSILPKRHVFLDWHIAWSKVETFRVSWRVSGVVSLLLSLFVF